MVNKLDSIYINVKNRYPNAVEFDVIIPKQYDLVLSLNRVDYQDIKMFINNVDDDIANKVILSYGGLQQNIIAYRKYSKSIQIFSAGVFRLDLDTKTSCLFVDKLRMILNDKPNKIK